MYDVARLHTLGKLQEWLIIIRKSLGDVPIILIGNKLAVEVAREVSEKEAIELAKRHGFSGYIEISTTT
jgi:hypothetical protein